MESTAVVDKSVVTILIIVTTVLLCVNIWTVLIDADTVVLCVTLWTDVAVCFVLVSV